jgi:thioredoxin family protein
MKPAVTAERFAQGMSFEQYLAYLGSSENLSREGNRGQRIDYSSALRAAYERFQLNEAQSAALEWLASRADGPARMLVIAEDWSSDCRRDVPTFGRIAAASGMELRIFNRDGQRLSTSNLEADPDSNADLMAQFLNHKHGHLYQSIPVCAFFTRQMEYLYHFTEYPAIYDKDRVVVQHIRAPRPGESPEQTRERADREFSELMRSPFWRIWTSATVDEIISALHRKSVLGVV